MENENSREDSNKKNVG